jgi:sodium/potassium-transporting ATPase subunit alpha
MLLICVGTDMAPAIALAYENGELDIMERMPRNAKLDHLVTKKLIAFSYMQIGMIEVCGGMFTYFAVLNDYGFPFTTVCFLN